MCALLCVGFLTCALTYSWMQGSKGRPAEDEEHTLRSVPTPDPPSPTDKSLTLKLDMSPSPSLSQPDLKLSLPPRKPFQSSDKSNRFPRYMIIGFGKAGTRALYDLLRLHPNITGPASEMRFFSTSKFTSQKIDTYLQQIPKPPKEGYTIEKSPDYILSPKAPGRIATSARELGITSANLKFIVMLRDPIDRAMSEYLEWVALRKRNHGPPLPSFDDMVWDTSSPHSINAAQPFLNASCYAQHIRRWFKTFPREQCCFVDGDNFNKHPFEEVHKLERCMGMSPFYKEDYFIYSPSRKLYCFRVPGRKVKCGKDTKGRTHPEIRTDILVKLREFFHPWNVQLSELIGQNWRNYDSVF